MSGRATIRDVARLAGVSPAAVSRFLNGNLDLPDKTSKKIQAAVRDLQYSPNASAKRLRNGRAETLGLVAPDLSNPFFALLASSIASRAWEREKDLLVWSSEDAVPRELSAIRRMKSAYIDGLIFITHNKNNPLLLQELQGAGPTVLLDEDVAGLSCSHVFVDNERGGWLATKTLIDHGHSAIAHIGSPRELMSAEARYNGWRRALGEAGIEVPDDYYLHLPIAQDSGRQALEQLMRLDTPPTAIFAGADPIAFGVLAASSQIGLRIPEDLSIIGFDGLPIGSLLNPPLTTVEQPIAELGRAAVDLLIRHIEEPDAPHEHLQLPIRLLKRGSVLPHPARRQT
jgi:LacI family transcriptional regulator